MRTTCLRLVLWAGAVALVFSMVPSAVAQCGSPTKLVKPAVWHPQYGGAPLTLVRATRNDDDDKEPSIVGMWHVIYTANSAFPSGNFPPTPFQFVESLKTWHADGTEFENAFLPPTGGNICFGVWKESHGSVKLHHIGLMFDSMGRVSNIFTDDEKVKVASNGKTYTATFDFKLWPPSFDAVGVGSPLAEVTGTTAGTRITVD